MKKYLIVIGIGVSYLIGILSIFHLRPSFLDLAIGLQMSIIITFTLAFGFLTYKNKQIILSVSSLTWIFLALLILVQPIVNEIIYPDSLIFPVFYCIILAFSSILVKIIINENNGREFLCKWLSVFLLVGGLVTVIILFFQLFSINMPFIANISNNTRPLGNILQPNQTAFVLCLGIVAILYLKELALYNRKFNILFLLVLACGIALTASRTGLIIMLFIPVIYNFIINEKSKVKNILLISFLLSVGYGIGLYLFNQFAFNSAGNTFFRLANDIKPIDERYSLQNLAFNLFTNSPITGYGWGNSLKGAFDYALQDNWFILAHHSHVFITQIAAELGVLGLIVLLPLCWIIYKNINFNMENVQAFPVIIVMISLIYSMSEYPLWYLRFSLIFAISISLIDPSIFKWKAHYNLPIAIIFIFTSFSSFFYYKEYLKYNYYTDLTYTDKLTTYQINELENVFGFRAYKEQLIYYSLPLDNHLLGQKISLGNRVISKVPAMVFLEKQAIYYALDNEKKKSLELFKKGCLIDYALNCSKIEGNLKRNAKDNPKIFGDIFVDFINWRRNN